MNKKEYFFIEESPYNQGKWTISIKLNEFYCKYTTGSYNILAARIMNLSYAQYLRFCRDILGAEIIGKNHKYPVAYFQKNANLLAFIKLLNVRANLIVWNKEHPDWKNHQEQVEANKKHDYKELDRLKKELAEQIKKRKGEKTEASTEVTSVDNNFQSSTSNFKIDPLTGLVNIDPLLLRVVR